MAPATKSSKKAMVPAARITMKIRKAASFLSELKILAKVILPLHYWRGHFYSFLNNGIKVSNYYIE